MANSRNPLDVVDDRTPGPASARPELLAPAGDKEMLRAAVANGADAVYFGLEDFNARRRAENSRSPPCRRRWTTCTTATSAGTSPSTR